MNPPVYNNGSINDYLRKVEEYKLFLKKNKYDNILEFINKILKLNRNLKLKSLLKFKKIKENNLFSDENHLIKLFNNEFPKVCDKIGIQHLENNILIKETLNKDKVINLINSILNLIEYKIYYRIIKKDKYYYITNL